MFDIRLVTRAPELQDGGCETIRGEIRLGDYREGFRAPLGPWTPGDYERQWRQAAERLLAGQPAAFWTVPWQFWWVAWPEEDAVAVQEHLLTADRLGAYACGPVPGPGTAPYELIGSRESQTEDGVSVSEWRVPLTSVCAWLSRRV